MLATLYALGVAASFSRPSVSHDNPFSEALFRTLKYRPEYPDKAFESLAAARDWMERFVLWYNIEHCHSALKFLTPEQWHLGHDAQLLARRREVYQQARARHPQRWSGQTRNWTPAPEVTLPTYRPTEVRACQSTEEKAA